MKFSLCISSLLHSPHKLLKDQFVFFTFFYAITCKLAEEKISTTEANGFTTGSPIMIILIPFYFIITIGSAVYAVHANPDAIMQYDKT